MIPKPIAVFFTGRRARYNPAFGDIESIVRQVPRESVCIVGSVPWESEYGTDEAVARAVESLPDLKLQLIVLPYIMTLGRAGGPIRNEGAAALTARIGRAMPGGCGCVAWPRIENRGGTVDAINAARRNGLRVTNRNTGERPFWLTERQGRLFNNGG